jgi:integrase
MARRESIIIFPHLNDCKGDFTKDWYVEYKYLIPGEIEKRIDRKYAGLNSGTAEERYKKAAEIIAEKTEWLKSGEYLKEANLNRVYEDELTYRNEARLYGKKKVGLPLMHRNMNDYLASAKRLKTENHYQNIQSKLRTFLAWLEKTNLADVRAEFIKRRHIIDFVVWLAENFDYSKVTIKKYLQVVRWYFDFELDRETIMSNPVARIENTGKVKDEAPIPFTWQERQDLKDLIAEADPQTWLACQIQFYCAIRPGTELRLMKIDWIDFGNKQIRVPCIEAKNKTTELVDIPDVLHVEFMRYGLHKCNRNFYVFGKKGVPGEEHLGKNTMRVRFNKYRDKLNIPENRKFYSWKHTGAIELVNAGALPLEMKEHLRHKHFDTTEKYLKNKIKNPKLRVNKYHVQL